MEKFLAKILCERPVLKGQPLVSMSQARRLIMCGQVRVNGTVVDDPAIKVDDAAEIEIKSENHAGP